jgi:hypothetical protein
MVHCPIRIGISETAINHPRECELTQQLVVRTVVGLFTQEANHLLLRRRQVGTHVLIVAFS